MLNYIIKCVYLPKMVPLIWGVGEFGVFWVLGFMGSLWYNRGEQGRHPHMGQNFPMKLIVPPTTVVGGWFGLCRGR